MTLQPITLSSSHNKPGIKKMEEEKKKKLGKLMHKTLAFELSSHF